MTLLKTSNFNYFGCCVYSLIVRKAFPQPPLLAPIRYASDGADMVLPDRIAPVDRQRQEQDRLLFLWSQLEEVHELGHAGPAHVTQTRQITWSVIVAFLDQAVERIARAISREMRGIVPWGVGAGSGGCNLVLVCYSHLVRRRRIVRPISLAFISPLQTP